jgi:RNA polymerase subunit RPABC4/transcription elongation factor Spt4
MAEKMINCKACGNEIAKSAKICPHCGRKNKRPLWKTLLIIFAVIVAFSVIVDVASKAGTSVGSGSQATANTNFIKPGMYKVGSEIAAGEYVVESLSQLGYYQLSSDSTGDFDSIIINDNLDRGTFGYVVVRNGEYIELQNCRMYPSAEKTITPADLSKIPPSTYKIGKDLPAGEYRLTVKSQPAYWERNRNNNQMDSIIANNNLQNSAYVKVFAGEYFKILGVEAALVQ